MNPKLNKTIVVLHISAAIYLVLSIASLTVSPKYLPFLAPYIALFIGMGVFVEIVIKGLKDNKYWAWIAGLVVCGLYIPSIFIVCGIIGLIGLLNKEVRTDFFKNKKKINFLTRVLSCQPKFSHGILCSDSFWFAARLNS